VEMESGADMGEACILREFTGMGYIGNSNGYTLLRFEILPPVILL